MLSVPPMGDRFWIMQIVDAWNNVPHAPGSRTLGGKGGDFALVGPAGRARCPRASPNCACPPTSSRSAAGTYTAGPQDYAAVHAIQDEYKLVPLSQWGKAYTPPAEVALKAGVSR